jgi:hypothetical protein
MSNPNVIKLRAWLRDFDRFPEVEGWECGGWTSVTSYPSGVTDVTMALVRVGSPEHEILCARPDRCASWSVEQLEAALEEGARVAYIRGMTLEQAAQTALGAHQAKGFLAEFPTIEAVVAAAHGGNEQALRVGAVFPKLPD